LRSDDDRKAQRRKGYARETLHLTTLDCGSQGAANSGIFQMMAGGAVEGDFTRMKFALANAAKDVRYYTQLAAESGISGPMSAPLSCKDTTRVRQ
jgi:hypothetical protein